MAAPGFFTLALGIGLASLGVLVLIFLFKFMFKTHTVDRSHLMEITRAEEPELFGLIDEIVSKVGTNFPKRVYLSTEVNAAVFYDSNFWSMIFPIKKNLQIGMGLINTVTTEELKAILSHEFGHFSQRTMKVGSYVYNVNQVIYNMLYDNESYDRIIQSWANASGYFSIFVAGAVKFIQGIQWILKQMYELVNLSYMGLSREMEFHADEIAAHVTGHLPLINSLRRMDLADYSYNTVLNFYGSLAKENLSSSNIFKEQEFVLNFLAKESELDTLDGLPFVTAESIKKRNKSKLIIKDQWASHPSLEERIKRLEALNLPNSSSSPQLATTYFKKIEETQSKLTDQLFANIQYEGEVHKQTLDEFNESYTREFTNNTFDKIYNGYYDNKNPNHFDLKIEINERSFDTVKDLFSDEMVEMVNEALALQNDIQIIEQIESHLLDIKTFDYDGMKITREDSKEVISKLKLELESLNNRITTNDIKIFQYFRKSELERGNDDRLFHLYEKFFQQDHEFDKKIEVYTFLSGATSFINEETPFDEIKKNFRNIKVHEVKLKESIKALMEDKEYSAEIDEDMQRNFDLYISQSWQYFSDDRYLDNELQILFTALNNYYYLISRGYFVMKRELLKYQSSLA
jgi:Zn-dependent protease with chaperone function